MNDFNRAIVLFPSSDFPVFLLRRGSTRAQDGPS